MRRLLRKKKGPVNRVCTIGWRFVEVPLSQSQSYAGTGMHAQISTQICMASSSESGRQSGSSLRPYPSFSGTSHTSVIFKYLSLDPGQQLVLESIQE